MYPSRLILCSCNKIEYMINRNVAMLYELQCCKFYLHPICIETVEMFKKTIETQCITYISKTYNSTHTITRFSNQAFIPTASPFFIPRLVWVLGNNT